MAENIVIEDLDNPIKHFAAFINMVESFINDVICVDEPEAKLTQTKNDFDLLDDLICCADENGELEMPDEIKESMYRGVTFAFSEILTNEYGLKWCIVKEGAFFGLGMRIPSDQKVFYIREMIDKYIEDNENISFETIYQNIGRLLEKDSA